MPDSNFLGSERKFQLKMSLFLVQQSGQSFATGLRVINLALRAMVKVERWTSASVTVRMSCPEKSAPVLELVGPWKTMGGDSMSMTKLAGLAGPTRGELLLFLFDSEGDELRPGRWKDLAMPFFRLTESMALREADRSWISLRKTVASLSASNVCL